MKSTTRLTITSVVFAVVLFSIYLLRPIQPEPDTLYIGDSMIQNWPTKTAIRNAGVGGNSSGDALYRYRSALWGDRYINATIWMGFGDIHGHISSERYHDNYRELVWTLGQHGVTHFVVMGLTPVDPKWDIPDARIRSENDWLRDYAAHCMPGFYTCEFVDTYDLLGDGQRLKAAYDSGDGLHINAAAYEVIEAHISSAGR
jgi:lysophospholipase L1-like esterase